MKKSLALLYGIVSYMVFLVAFLYAIGFVGNFLVPKSIDSGTESSFAQAVLINATLLSVFALQHSIMARPAFKKWWTTMISPAIERSTYVLLSSLALLLIYWQWVPMKTIVWSTENASAVMTWNVVYFFGWLIVFLSTFMINHFDLFGLKQVFDNLRDKQNVSGEFKINYFYGIVRHPIMLGFIIAFWATPVMTLGHLVFSITTTLYILIAVKFFEERDLLKAHPVEYAAYKKKVPMVIPFTGKRK